MPDAETPNLPSRHTKGTQLDAFGYETLVFANDHRRIGSVISHPRFPLRRDGAGPEVRLPLLRRVVCAVSRHEYLVPEATKDVRVRYHIALLVLREVCRVRLDRVIVRPPVNRHVRELRL